MIGHSGEVPGYNSSMYYLPSLDAISITLINRYPSEIEGLADQVNIALIETMVAPYWAGFEYPDPADFGALSWTEAFKAAPSFYEMQEYYDKRDGSFLRLTLSERGPAPVLDSICIEPQTPVYEGPVVVLVNPGTISSGEGPPAYLSRLPNVMVLGFHGTNGSFGMVGGMIAFPGEYVPKYPFGRSVDSEGTIQLDSRNGIGGVAPDIRVPKTLVNVLAFAAGTDVELQYAIRYLDIHRESR